MDGKPNLPGPPPDPLDFFIAVKKAAENSVEKLNERFENAGENATIGSIAGGVVGGLAGTAGGIAVSFLVTTNPVVGALFGLTGMAMSGIGGGVAGFKIGEEIDRREGK